MTVPRKKVVPIPPATGRIEIESVRDYVDETLERMGAGKLDLTDPQARARFADWLVIVLTSYLHRLEFDLEKGATRGVAQVLQAAVDPEYYLKARRRRLQRRETMQRQQAESNARTQVWLAAREAETAAFQEAIENGQVKLFPGTERPQA